MVAASFSLRWILRIFLKPPQAQGLVAIKKAIFGDLSPSPQPYPARREGVAVGIHPLRERELFKERE